MLIAFAVGLRAAKDAIGACLITAFVLTVELPPSALVKGLRPRRPAKARQEVRLLTAQAPPIGAVVLVDLTSPTAVAEAGPVVERPAIDGLPAAAVAPKQQLGARQLAVRRLPKPAVPRAVTAIQVKLIDPKVARPSGPSGVAERHHEARHALLDVVRPQARTPRPRLMRRVLLPSIRAGPAIPPTAVLAANAVDAKRPDHGPPSQRAVPVTRGVVPSVAQAETAIALALIDACRGESRHVLAALRSAERLAGRARAGPNAATVGTEALRLAEDGVPPCAIVGGPDALVALTSQGLLGPTSRPQTSSHAPPKAVMVLAGRKALQASQVMLATLGHADPSAATAVTEGQPPASGAVLATAWRLEAATRPKGPSDTSPAVPPLLAAPNGAIEDAVATPCLA